MCIVLKFFVIILIFIDICYGANGKIVIVNTDEALYTMEIMTVLNEKEIEIKLNIEIGNRFTSLNDN